MRIARVQLLFKSTIIGLIVNWISSINIRADILHITGDVHYLAFFKKPPLIITVHDLHSIFKGSTLGIKIKKWLWVTRPFNKARHLVAISESTKSEIVQLMPEIREKISVIPNPVSPVFKLSLKSESNGCPTILHVGTANHKNLEKVIVALQNEEIELLILGILSNQQNSLLKESGIKYKTFSLLPYEKVYELYKRSDVVSFPSLYEGFGMPIVEAQAVGRPLLTSDLPAIKDIAGTGALFVDPHSIDDLKHGFKELINNAELRNQLVSNGLDNVTRYNARKVADQYLSLYREVVYRT